MALRFVLFIAVLFSFLAEAMSSDEEEKQDAVLSFEEIIFPFANSQDENLIGDTCDKLEEGREGPEIRAALDEKKRSKALKNRMRSLSYFCSLVAPLAGYYLLGGPSELAPGLALMIIGNTARALSVDYHGEGAFGALISTCGALHFTVNAYYLMQKPCN